MFAGMLKTHIRRRFATRLSYCYPMHLNDTFQIGLHAATYDAIVIGSGVSGGWAAKELCEKGLKTLVLGRGRPVRHREDYLTEHKAPWEFDLRGDLTRDEQQRYT
ncbi:MAG: hypothetical protein OHK0039_32950 [Bacteroidia bacterium]